MYEFRKEAEYMYIRLYKLSHEELVRNKIIIMLSLQLV